MTVHTLEEVAALRMCAGQGKLENGALDASVRMDAGALPTLHDRYGISTDAVVASVKSWL